MTEHISAPTLEPLSKPVGEGFLWLLTDKERRHIGQLLNVEDSAISMTGNLMMQDRKNCECCGKPSGLDDLVQNAMALNIHSTNFMLDVLTNGPKNGSPEHSLRCSGCGKMFEGKFGWGSGDWFDDF